MVGCPALEITILVNHLAGTFEASLALNDLWGDDEKGDE